MKEDKKTEKEKFQSDLKLFLDIIYLFKRGISIEKAISQVYQLPKNAYLYESPEELARECNNAFHDIFLRFLFNIFIKIQTVDHRKALKVIDNMLPIIERQHELEIMRNNILKSQKFKVYTALFVATLSMIILITIDFILPGIFGSSEILYQYDENNFFPLVMAVGTLILSIITGIKLSFSLVKRFSIERT